MRSLLQFFFADNLWAQQEVAQCLDREALTPIVQAFDPYAGRATEPNFENRRVLK